MFLRAYHRACRESNWKKWLDTFHLSTLGDSTKPLRLLISISLSVSAMRFTCRVIKSRIKPDDRMTASSFRQDYYLQIPKGIFALSYRQNMRYEQYSLWQHSTTRN
jgi:hypothetical protein